MWVCQTLSLILSDLTEFCKFFNTCKCIFAGGYAERLRGCVPGKEGGIQGLVGLAQSIQTVGSLLRTPGEQSRLEKFGKKWVWQIHFIGKKTLDYIWSNSLARVKNLTNLHSTLKYRACLNETDRDNHTSLLHPGLNYYCNMFYHRDMI